MNWHLEPARGYRTFLDCLSRAIQSFDVDVLGYVVMSNHYHAVLRCPPEPRFSALTSRRTTCRHRRRWPASHPKSTVIGQCIRAFKLAVSKRIQDALDISGHFWDGKHHRRKLVDAWETLVALAYDHRNPVRAGIAPLPEQYKRSSAQWWARGDPRPIPLVQRGELPFGISVERFRAELLAFQRDKRLDDVMSRFAKTRQRLDGPRGRAVLRSLFKEAGLSVRHQCRSGVP